MYWTLDPVQDGDSRATEAPPQGRFVVQRHTDAEGPHLDVRLEQEGYLLGWRVEGCSLEGNAWATAKAPHPLHWLEQDGDAVREDEGVYAWLSCTEDGGTLVLRGRGGTRVLGLRRRSGLPVTAVRAIARVLTEHGVAPQEAATLMIDGLTARRQALARFCGLGRELDGAAFDETVWRKTLDRRPLEEIHAHLRAYEVRFDAKYPPLPVSRPEALPDQEEGEARAEQVLAILQG